MKNITPSSSNVFADIGLPDAEEMLVKSKMAFRIAQTIQDRKLTQKKAAELTGLPQPRISALLRGRFRGISESKLMECLNALGDDVQITIRRHKSKGAFAAGHTRVVYA